MRPAHRFVTGLTVVSCGAIVLLGSSLARGQNQDAPIIITPALPATPAAPIAPAPQKSISPVNSLIIRPTKTQGRFDVEANNVTPVTLVEELARLANKKVIISDDVGRQRVTIFQAFKNQTPGEVMDALTTLLINGKSLAWGHAGPDTWLVVLHRAPVFQNRIVQVPTLPALPYALPQPLPQPLPPGNSMPTLRNRGKNDPPKDGTPFLFNGETYYYVPLQKQAKEEK
jgi:hypothetical protein